MSSFHRIASEAWRAAVLCSHPWRSNSAMSPENSSCDCRFLFRDRRVAISDSYISNPTPDYSCQVSTDSYRAAQPSHLRHQPARRSHQLAKTNAYSVISPHDVAEACPRLRQRIRASQRQPSQPASADAVRDGKTTYLFPRSRQNLPSLSAALVPRHAAVTKTASPPQVPWPAPLLPGHHSSLVRAFYSCPSGRTAKRKGGGGPEEVMERMRGSEKWLLLGRMIQVTSSFIRTAP